VANEGDDRRPTLARGNRLVVGLPRPTTVVGQFENDCGACTHWGIQTAYYTVVTSRLC